MTVAERYPDLDFSRCVPLGCLLPARAERSMIAVAIRERNYAADTLKARSKRATAARVPNPAYEAWVAEGVKLAHQKRSAKDGLGRALSPAHRPGRSLGVAVFERRIREIAALQAKHRARRPERWAAGRAA